MIPETKTLLIGAGERLLAYDLDQPKLLWEDHIEAGFWGWARHNEIIVMSAELELAAWDTAGRKLWSTFVEPPWSYSVDESTVNLNVIGEKSSFALAVGPNTNGK
ncbi:MAG: hypothetical protein AAGA30_13940 [Planctomycetota bacterium]